MDEEIRRGGEAVAFELDLQFRGRRCQAHTRFLVAALAEAV